MSEPERPVVPVPARDSPHLERVLAVVFDEGTVGWTPPWTAMPSPQETTIGSVASVGTTKPAHDGSAEPLCTFTSLLPRTLKASSRAATNSYTVG